jgi:hypothetical protein
MYLYDDELFSNTLADSITEVSHGIVYVLCAGIMLIPLALLVGLLYSGFRQRRLKDANEAAPDRDDRPRAGQAL